MQAPKRVMQELTRRESRESRSGWGEYERKSPRGPAGVVATACRQRGPDATREAPAVIDSAINGATRESQARPLGVAERLVVLEETG